MPGGRVLLIRAGNGDQHPAQPGLAEFGKDQVFPSPHRHLGMKQRPTPAGVSSQAPRLQQELKPPGLGTGSSFPPHNQSPFHRAGTRRTLRTLPAQTMITGCGIPTPEGLGAVGAA